MIKKILLVSIIFISLFSVVSATEFTPQGNINLYEWYGLINITSINDTDGIDLYTDLLFQSGYDITGVDDINGTDVFVTNLYATNLEQNLDGTGYILTIGNLKGATWVNSTNSDLTNLYVTNLYATNLEKDLDGTGYTITGGTLTDGTITITGGDLTGADDINGTQLFVTDVIATNAYGFTWVNSTNSEIGTLYVTSLTDDTLTISSGSITGGVWTNFTNSDLTNLYITNLYATNLEHNLDGTGYNLTIGGILSDYYYNSTGHLEWIGPNNILDVDDSDIEGDINTYIDVDGDTATTGSTFDWANAIFNNITEIGDVQIVDSNNGTDIQERINALGSRGTVLIPPGTYEISSQIEISNIGVILMGSGRGATTINYTGSETSAINVTANLVTIKDLSVRTDTASVNSTAIHTNAKRGVYDNLYIYSNGHGIVINTTSTSASFNSMMNIQIFGSTGDNIGFSGVYITNATSAYSHDNYIENVDVQEFDYGFYLGYLNNHQTLSHVTAQSCNTTGIHIESGSNLIMNPYTESNEEIGINITSTGDKTTIIGARAYNEIEDNGSGTSIIYGTETVLRKLTMNGDINMTSGILYVTNDIEMDTNAINDVKSIYSDYSILDIQATYAGAVELRIDAIPSDLSSNSNIRLFRETNTTGTRNFIIYAGNGTSTFTFKVDAATGDITSKGWLDLSDYLDMSGNDINNVTSIDGDGSAVRFDDDIDLNDNELIDVIIDKEATLDICNSTYTGKIQYNTTDNEFYGCNSTNWEKLSP